MFYCDNRLMAVVWNRTCIIVCSSLYRLRGKLGQEEALSGEPGCSSVTWTVSLGHFAFCGWSIWRPHQLCRVGTDILMPVREWTPTQGRDRCVDNGSLQIETAGGLHPETANKRHRRQKGWVANPAGKSQGPRLQWHTPAISVESWKGHNRPP